MGELADLKNDRGCPKWNFEGSCVVLTPTRCPGSISYMLANLKEPLPDPQQGGQGSAQQRTEMGPG